MFLKLEKLVYSQQVFLLGLEIASARTTLDDRRMKFYNILEIREIVCKIFKCSNN